MISPPRALAAAGVILLLGDAAPAADTRSVADSAGRRAEVRIERVLHRGHLARLGPPHEVITRESLREVYGGDGRTACVCVPTLGVRGPQPPPGS